MSSPTWLNTDDCTEAVSYRCPVCGRQGTAKYSPACPIEDFEAWRRMLHCDRCAAYLEGKRRVIGKINHWLSRLPAPEEQTRQQDVMREIEAGLTRWTKGLAHLVCEHWRRPMEWDVSLVEVLMRRPAEAGKWVGGYIRQMSRKGELL